MSNQSDSGGKIIQVADPRFRRLSDSYIKYLLAKDGHLAFLDDFIKAIVNDLPLECRTCEINSISSKNVELYRNHAQEKGGYLDIAAVSDTGVAFDIEVQNYRDKNLFSRFCYYGAKLYSEQVVIGEDYGALKPVEIVGLLSFEYFDDDSPYHTCCTLANIHTNKIVTDQVIMHFIETPKFKRVQRQGKVRSRLDRWMQYLTCADPQAVLNFAKNDAIFADVLEAEKMFIQDEEKMREFYQKKEAGYWAGVIANAKDEGKAEGLAEGEAKGRAEAKAEAKVEEKKNLLEIARQLLNTGTDRLNIQKCLKLTDEEMASL